MPSRCRRTGKRRIGRRIGPRSTRRSRRVWRSAERKCDADDARGKKEVRAVSAVIPGRALSRANPESRTMRDASGFRVRRSAPSRNDANASIHLHHLLGLGADSGDGLDLERRAAGFLRDLAVLLDDEAERGRVLFEAAQQLGRHTPVGALRAVLIDDVEEHEFAFGVGSRFFGHRPTPILFLVIPGRRGAPDPESRGVTCGSGFRVRRCAAPRNDELILRVWQKENAGVLRRRFAFNKMLDGLQIGSSGLAVLAVGFDVERKLLAFVEIAHAGALDRRDVNEHIRPAAVLHDEAETFLGVEELNGTCGHSGLLLKTHMCVYAPCEPFVWASYPDSACSW